MPREKFGCAGNIGDPMREISARARFRDCQRLFSLRQKFDHNFFQVFAIAGKNRRTKFRFDDPFGLIERRRFADDSQIDFTGRAQ